jgi:hypothetical protein
MDGLVLDHARASQETRDDGGALAGRVFASLFRDWRLHTFGCVHVAARKGDPVFIGDSLADVVVAIAGAATRDRCVRGTGWPPGGTR